MILHVIIIAYERPIPLRGLIDSFLVQTCQAYKLYIIHDGEPSKGIKDLIKSYNNPLYSNFAPLIDFTWSKTRVQNYGHPNRKWGIERLQGQNDDYVLITNDDNYYVPTFVGQMLNAGKALNVGITICDTIHSHLGHVVQGSVLAEGGIDMGAFIVRYPVAKTVGFNHIHMSADGRYAAECGGYCNTHGLQVVHTHRPLFIHN
jgi:hypothetical protein